MKEYIKTLKIIESIHINALFLKFNFQTSFFFLLLSSFSNFDFRLNLFIFKSKYHNHDLNFIIFVFSNQDFFSFLFYNNCLMLIIHFFIIYIITFSLVYFNKNHRNKKKLTLKLIYHLYNVKFHNRENFKIITIIISISKEKKLKIIFYNYYKLKNLIIINFLRNFAMCDYDIIIIQNF